MKDKIIGTLYVVTIIAMIVVALNIYTSRIEQINNGEITQVSESYMK